jgi:PRTRC genetic system ThiF family protein
MNYDHVAHPDLLSDRVTIALAGAGGSGSLMLTGLARLNSSIRALGHPGLDVYVYDPDTVSEANLGRQMFAPADVGRNKADVLVTRANAWYGTAWRAIPARFNRAPEAELGIVVSCVDTARARIEIARTCEQQEALYWLDLGNRAADGQVVLGIPAQDEEHRAYTCRLPTVLELFPQIVSDAAKLDNDDAPSCSLAQALERQELFVNQAVVTPALQLLWLLFRYGRTSWCGAIVNLASGRMNPIPVDPLAWLRIGGYHADRHITQQHVDAIARGVSPSPIAMPLKEHRRLVQQAKEEATA